MNKFEKTPKVRVDLTALNNKRNNSDNARSKLLCFFLCDAFSSYLIFVIS